MKLKAMQLAVQHGWRVFPVWGVDSVGRCNCPAGATCSSAGKHPIPRDGFKSASADPDHIEQLWNGKDADANIGVRTGDGIVVLDVDGPAGEESLAELLGEFEAIVPTVTARTARGAHYYFSTDEHLKSAVAIRPGLDIRAQGAYVIAPPSTHKSGKAYAWEPGHGPDEVSIAPLPEWLRNLLDVAGERSAAPNAHAAADAIRFPLGTRNHGLASLAGTMHSRGMSAGAIRAALRAENEAACDPPLPDSEVVEIAESITRYKRDPALPKWVADPLPALLAPIEAEDRDLRPAEKTTFPRTLVGATDALLTSALRPKLLGIGADDDCGWDELRHVITVNGEEADADNLVLTFRYNAEVQLTATGDSHKPLNYSPDLAADALRKAAQTLHSYNPLKEYLLGLKWDGVRRIDTIGETILRIAPTRLESIFIRKWMISAVARAIQPGSKADHVLVFAGPQGVGKSTFFAALVPAPKYVLTSKIDITNPAQAGMVMRGKWIAEFSELSGLNKREAEDVKDFLSQSHDTFRAPYARTAKDHPRVTVFGGTTNNDTILRDSTGNRRFWIVRAPAKLDIDALKQIRDQLWAEAHAAYGAGENWWLDAEDEQAAEEARAEYRDSHVLTDVVLEYAQGELRKGRNGVTVSEVLMNALKLDAKEMLTQSPAKTVTEILRTANWRKGKVYSLDGVRTSGWRPPSAFGLDE